MKGESSWVNVFYIECKYESSDNLIVLHSKADSSDTCSLCWYSRRHSSWSSACRTRCSRTPLQWMTAAMMNHNEWMMMKYSSHCSDSSSLLPEVQRRMYLQDTGSIYHDHHAQSHSLFYFELHCRYIHRLDWIYKGEWGWCLTMRTSTSFWFPYRINRCMAFWYSLSNIASNSLARLLTSDSVRYRRYEVMNGWMDWDRLLPYLEHWK